MTIFGIRITTERAYRAQRAEELQSHVEECNTFLQAYQAFEQKIEELDMQKAWWRMRYEMCALRAIEIRPLRTKVSQIPELAITAGEQRITIRPHRKFGLEFEVNPR